MRRLLILAVAAALAAYGAAYTSSGSGNWSVAATWGGAGVPGNGDTATIAAGHVVTVDVNTTVGTSPAAGNTVLTITTTGQLVVASGVTFVVRGDTVFTSTASGDPVVLVNAGGVWEFDASAAASPGSTNYRFTKSTTGTQPRAFRCAGTSGSHCTVRSNAGGGMGYFSFGGLGGYGPSLDADYTDFVRIGASELRVGPSGSYVDIQDSTFTNCDHLLVRTEGGTHSYRYNVHTGGVNADKIDVTLTLMGASTPTVTIEGNVFTGRFGWVATSVSPTGHIIRGNYFSYRTYYTLTGTSAWTEFSGNFQRLVSAAAFQLNNSLTDSYFVVDEDGYDRHFTGVTVARPWTVSNSIFEWAGTHTDFGGYDIVLVGNPASATTFGVNGNIFTRAMGVYSGAPTASGYPLSVYSTVTNGRFQMSHNSAYLSGYFMANFLDSNATAGLMTLYKSNLAQGSFVYLGPVQIRQSTAMKDACATDADCNYNSAVAGRTPAQYYTGSWTVPPGPPSGVGANDTEANPRLADETRQMPNFDVRYLGLPLGPAWATSTSYAVGDIVSAANANVYSGEALNYRCIVAHTSGDTTRPGTGSGWRTNWEWASLYQIRQRIAAKASYTDGAIGCSGCTVIQALVRWVRRGWTPQNLALYGKAHDGGTPGAAEMDKPVTRGAWW